MPTLLMSSFIGLSIILVVSLINLIMFRKTTAALILVEHAIVGTIISIAFGPITILYTFLFTAFLMFLKYKNYKEEGSDLDYSDRIYSLSMISNKLYRPKKLVIGKILPVCSKEIKYNLKPIELDDTILSGSLLITGSSGSGKTTTMKTIIKQRLDEKRPVVFFDYKGDEEILDEIKEFAKQVNIPYYEFSARDCTFTYDPFKNLNETGKVEALMNTRRWSSAGTDEHYKTAMQLAIQNVIREYDKFREINNDTRNYLSGLYDFSKSYRPQSNERDGFNNLCKSLEIILTSRAKELFGDNSTFTFEDDGPYVICFSFTSANKALANSLSSFTYTDIMDRGTNRHYKDKLLLCVDEFGTLESSTIIKDLLEKGRSGGVQTVFSILDVNQIAMNAGEHFVQAILGTISNFIVHNGATQQTAELLAGVQKFNKSFDIMSLRKPYRGKKPTAMFISKFSLINRKNNQEVYRMTPYTECLKVKHTNEESKQEIEEIDEIIIPNAEDLDLTKPIDNIDNYL